MKRLILIASMAGVLSCGRPMSPDQLREWQSQTLFTCCNIHYEGTDVSDANYVVGSILPFGSPVTLDNMTRDSATFTSGGTKLTLQHRYGREQETQRQYFGKILVTEDPRLRFNSYPTQVQQAITDGLVERGMTKEQVVMSLGYPPTHRTASLDQDDWTYWRNRWMTYNVRFDPQGKVSSFAGEAPTRNEPIVAPTPTPMKKAPAAKPKKKRKK